MSLTAQQKFNKIASLTSIIAAKRSSEGRLWTRSPTQVIIRGQFLATKISCNNNLLMILITFWIFNLKIILHEHSMTYNFASSFFVKLYCVIAYYAAYDNVWFMVLFTLFNNERNQDWSCLQYHVHTHKHLKWQHRRPCDAFSLNTELWWTYSSQQLSDIFTCDVLLQ